MKISNKKIKNKKRKTCIICQNPNLSKIVDPILFKAEMPLDSLITKLENQGIYLTKEILKKHMTHIYYEDEREYEPIKLTNLELVEIELGRIEKQIEYLVKNGDEGGIQYLNLIREKQKLIELRAKIEGEINQTVNVNIPGWIEEIPDEDDN